MTLAMQAGICWPCCRTRHPCQKSPPAAWPPSGDPAGWAAAIARTTPVLLGLFSWLILVGYCLHRVGPLHPRRAAWYAKTVPTFSDVLACVRHAPHLRVDFVQSPANEIGKA